MSAIYVEICIRSDLERVWELTQNPHLHQRWDLRFTEISYLPRPDPSEPQRFLYQTKVGFGVPIRGAGESVGEKQDEGKRSSALKFWSDDPRSLIKAGSGYWQYEKDGDGLWFRTRYDYTVRYGFVGKVLDLVFRHVLGTATAWSFDAMRLWAERDISPELSVLRMRIHAAARMSLAFVWAYQGIIPKAFARIEEMEMAIASGVPANIAPQMVTLIGMAEVLIALALLLLWQKRWVLLAQGALPFVLPIGVLFAMPHVFLLPFNPLTLAVCMAALGICGFVAAKDMPSAARCRRKPR